MAVTHFMPTVVAFYLILLNCQTLGKLKVLALCPGGGCRWSRAAGGGGMLILRAT